MWGIPAAIFFIAFIHRVVPGVIAKDVMQAFGATGAIVGLLSSMYFYSYAGFMIPAGLLIDGFGARVMIAAGAAVMGAGSLAMGAATAEPLLFAGRFVVGLGATVTFIGALKIGAAWFPPSQFATLAAVTATVGVLGSIAGTYPLAALVAVAGWRGAFLILGLLTLVLAALCALLVRNHPAGSAAADAPAPSLAGMVGGMILVLGNRHTWPPFLAFFFAYAAMGNQMLWIVPYLRDVYELSTTQAALYASAPSLAMLASGPLTGYLSDRVVKRRKLPYTVLTGVSLVIWIAFVATLGTLPLGGVFALLFAMGLAGGAFVLTWPLGREVNPPSLSGIAVAVVNLGGFLGAALTQGPLGAVLDARWTGVSVAGARVYPLAAYQAAFSVCAGFTLVALLVTLGLRETRGENIHHQLARGVAARSQPAPRGGYSP
jgi:MFS family permease